MEIQAFEEAAAEMLDILKHTGIEYVRKIPPDFISLLEKKLQKHTNHL